MRWKYDSIKDFLFSPHECLCIKITISWSHAGCVTFTGGNCGIRNYGDSGRVVNGKTAVRNSWPWQARMTLRGAHKCGGSLVAPGWVLTAAHCVGGSSYNPGYRIILGTLVLWVLRELWTAALVPYSHLKPRNKKTLLSNML